jgi:hypothetical protein
LRGELRAQHSVRSDGSSENKQIPAQNEFQFPDSNKVHSPVKILIGDKTQGVIEMRGKILTTSYWLHVELGKNI